MRRIFAVMLIFALDALACVAMVNGAGRFMSIPADKLAAQMDLAIVPLAMMCAAVIVGPVIGVAFEIKLKRSSWTSHVTQQCALFGNAICGGLLTILGFLSWLKAAAVGHRFFIGVAPVESDRRIVIVAVILLCIAVGVSVFGPIVRLKMVEGRP